MDLIKLNAQFRGTDLVEGWDSLIWTERFFSCGDFQMKTPYVKNHRDLLPVGSYLGLRDTEEVMLVEDHLIETDENNVDWLTVSGRTFEVIGEQRYTFRITTGTGPGSATAALKYGSQVDSNRASLVVFLIFDRYSENAEDVTERIPGVRYIQTDVDYYYDQPPQVDIDYTAPMSDIYSEVYRLLKADGAGLRNKRQPGEIEADNLVIEFYRGADRTVKQTKNEPVIFTTDQGNFQNPKFLESIRNYKNIAYIVSPIWSRKVYAYGIVPGSLSGKDLRPLYVDASDYTSASGTSPSRVLYTRARNALAEYNDTVFIEGEISAQSASKRGRTPMRTPPSEWYTGYVASGSVRMGQYDLGDLVTVIGKYGMSQSMQVTEYVRTEDREGYKEFPILNQV